MIFFDFLVLNDSNLHLPLKGAIVIDTLQFCGHFLVLKLYGLGIPNIIWAFWGTNNVKKDFETCEYSQIWLG